MRFFGYESGCQRHFPEYRLEFVVSRNERVQLLVYESCISLCSVLVEDILFHRAEMLVRRG